MKPFLTSAQRSKRHQEPSININYYLRCRIFDRILRFLRPSLRRPLPVFLTPTRAPITTKQGMIDDAVDL